MKSDKINNRERELWVDNDEGLYRMWKSSGLSKRNFLKENRELIDNVISNVTSGKKRSSYLIYG